MLFACFAVKCHQWASSNPQAQCDALTVDIDRQDAHTHHLTYLHDLRWVLYAALGHLRHMHQTFLMHADVHKCAKLRDVCHLAVQHHPFVQVLDVGHIVVKLDILGTLARVTAWLLKLVPIVVMSVALFVPNLYGSELAQLAFWLFVLIYVGLLARYVVLFRREYRRYEMQMDNYFSDEDARRLHWVKRSFYIALTIGVLALVYALMPVAPVASVFMAVVIVFYTAFGVRFINYALHFPAIETAITADDDVEPSDPQADDLVMMQRIDDLMNQEKLYRRLDLSVGDIAERLDEKPRVVSSVIRACRQMNFKTYINEFRVQEAKRLFDEDKENTRTIEAISVEAGFANRSSFYRVFKSSQGISPTDYRLAAK